MKNTLYFLFFLCPVTLFGQDETLITKLNEAMGGVCVAEMGKKEMTLSFYRNNKLIRTEEFRPDYVDTTRISFNEDENALILFCRENYEGCFDRRILKTKNHSRYSRMTIVINEGANGEELVKQWKDVIKVTSE